MKYKLSGDDSRTVSVSVTLIDSTSGAPDTEPVLLYMRRLLTRIYLLTRMTNNSLIINIMATKEVLTMNAIVKQMLVISYLISTLF